MAEDDSPNGPITGGPQPTGTERGSDEGLIQTFLFADIRGYTRFSQEHGDEAAGRLAARFADVTTQVIEAAGGTVLELRGDEALSIFSTTRRAIRAAIDLQARFLAETSSDPTLPLPVGIGIDTGEAVPVAGGFRGRALNLAARLCGAAKAGEILATREAIHLAGQMDGVHVEDRGVSSFKNIAEPVGVMRITGEGEDTAHWFAEHVTPPAPPELSHGRRRLGIAVLATALIAAVAIPLIGTRGSATTSIEPNSIGVIDPQSGEVRATIGSPSGPGAILADGDRVWVANPDAGTVSRIDVGSRSLVQTVPVGKDPSAMAAGFAAIWVVDSGGPTLSRISPATNTVVKTIDLGNGPAGVTVGDGSVWITNRFDGTVWRIDPRTDKVVDSIPVGLDPGGIAFGSGSVWVSLAGLNSVVRIDPATDSITHSIPVGGGPDSLTVSHESVWVTNTLDGTVTRIDPVTNSVASTIEVGKGPAAVASVGAEILVANEADGSISHIASGQGLARQISTGSVPQGLAGVGDDVWVTVRGAAKSHLGGTLRVSQYTAPSLDSRVAYDSPSWQVLHETGDGLVGFGSVGGTQGSSLQPDLASTLPSPTADGKTYLFSLRSGIRYSNGEPVRASDFRRAIEQGFLLDSVSHEALYGGLVGADACAKEPESCSLSHAIVTDRATGEIAFHLVAPDPEFLYKLALPFAYPVPASVSIVDRSSTGLPGTGPYMLRSPMGPTGFTLVRNPFFRVWSPQTQPAGNVDQIEWTLGVDPDAQVKAVITGTADVAIDAAYSSLFRHLLVRFPAQVHTSLSRDTWWVALDNQTPPFDDVRVRRALNYALDRQQVVQLFNGAALPTCQQLPPNFPGFEPYCRYTTRPGPGGTWTAPDIKKAKKLIRQSGTRGMDITIEYFKGWEPFKNYMVKFLDSLGFIGHGKVVDNDVFYGGGRFQMREIDGWSADYPAASTFFLNRFTCGAPSPSGVVPERFCDPHVDAMIARAHRVEGEDQAAASRLWADVDRAIADEAPYLWLTNPLHVDFVSEGVGNYQQSVQWGMLLDQAWVR